MPQPLLPDLPGFSIEQITLAAEVITVLAQSYQIRLSSVQRSRPPVIGGPSSDNLWMSL